MTDLTSPGGARIAVRPRCPVHGQMRLDFALDTWTCAGWDGEGCDHRVRAEDLNWMPAANVRLALITSEGQTRWQT